LQYFTEAETLMTPRPVVRNAALLALSVCLVLSVGCKRHRKTVSKPNTDAYSDNLKPIVAAPTLKVMHWPNYADYQPLVQTFYDDRNFEIAWSRDFKPTDSAVQFIQAFKTADAKGLFPEDYDASLWDARAQKLAGKNEDDVATFDAAMTVSVMRYISDLHIGRVNPTHFNFDIDAQTKKYDLPEFVSDQAVDATDVPKLIATVEPDSDLYRGAEKSLAHYLELAKQQTQAQSAPLPTVAKPLSVGQSYENLGGLESRLSLEGYGPFDSNVQPGPGVFDQAVSDAVKAYQGRHGLSPDGKLTPATIASINVPLSDRCKQLADSLERWRWLPTDHVNPRLMVNLPEFVLRGYEPDHKQAFKMNVVVGQVVGEHQTPVFTQTMKYLIFRPYWNVPISIVRKELMGHISKSGIGYLASKNFEVTDSKGSVLSSYTPHEVEQGGVMVREKPGPKNSLGLVKFMFPNEYDIYLHSTPAPQLFARSRRDFSHGCVRVQKPDELAAWVLSGQTDKDGDWDLARVQEAMNNGQDNKQVNLKTPLSIVIFYMTANVDEDGNTQFFDDIYGYDKQLEAVLAKGMPYPATQGKVNPKAKGGDTQ
jgi:murein L,D-transpeptidase YcbB/YkuD